MLIFQLFFAKYSSVRAITSSVKLNQENDHVQLVYQYHNHLSGPMCGRVAGGLLKFSIRNVLVLLVSGELHLVIFRVWGAILELMLVRETA